jgi:hypothetical protein
MLVQLDTKILSSFLLYIDHEIQSKGSAYTNETVYFYPERSSILNNYTYTSTIKPICNDTSIAGANILSGVYIGNSYISVGESGLRAINHYQGALYFTGINPGSGPISGAGAIKEFVVKITDKTDWKLLFETQYLSNGGHPIPATTGLGLDTEVSPIVFLRLKGQENKPFGFSKLDNQTMYVRAIIIADTEFQKMGAVSILKNLNYHSIPIIASTPFDSVGNMTGINYNFTQLPIDNSVTPIVLSVRSIDIPQEGHYKDIRRNMALVDFEISSVAKS